MVESHINSPLRLTILLVIIISRNGRKYLIDSILTDIPYLISKSEVMNEWILSGSPSSICNMKMCLLRVCMQLNVISTKYQNRFLKFKTQFMPIRTSWAVSNPFPRYTWFSINDTYVRKDPNSHMNNVCLNKFIMCLLIKKKKHNNTDIIWLPLPQWLGDSNARAVANRLHSYANTNFDGLRV